MGKWFLILIPVALVATIIGLTIYLQPNDFLGCSNTPVDTAPCQKADAIVVVSGGDTEARTQAGINLYRKGWADVLVLSGAALDKTGPSNAAAMRLQALDSGVPENAIVIEENAANTQQNATNAKSIFEERHFGNVILVTSGYHQRRASLEFTKRADSVTIRNYPIMDKDWNWYWWMTPRGWWLAAGETAKVIAFYIGVSE